MATMAECPECGAKLKKDNLRRHVQKVHGEGARVRKAKGAGTSAAPAVTFPWRVFAALAVVGLVVGAGYWVATAPQGPSNPPTPPGAKPVAVLQVRWGSTSGEIQVELDTAKAPVTAGNFINLVKRGFYDGLTFHRIVPDFVIQGGDPNGDGSGGSGEKIPWEDTGLRNLRHTIAMARSTPQDATSQFFINLKDNENLDAPAQQYPYVVFGKVIQGQSVVDAIARVETGANDRPLQPVTITSARIVE